MSQVSTFSSTARIGAVRGRVSTRSRGRVGNRGSRLVVRAEDKLCKDMVNEKKDVSGLEGSVKVTFLGANGQEYTLDCPLVSHPEFADSLSTHS